MKTTKLEENPFYQARKKAAQYNDRLNSREGASEELGYQTHSNMTDWELGNKNPSPENVLRMADLYNAPWLCNYYCKNMCPLGGDWPAVDAEAMESFDRITVKALSTMEKLSEQKTTLLEIAADGHVSEDERGSMEAIIEVLKEMEGVSQSFQMWLKKHR